MRVAEPTLSRTQQDELDIVSAVRRLPAASRAQLVESTAISRTTLTDHVSRLMSAGLLLETGLAPSSGGRPFRGVRFTDDGILLLAELGATSLTVGLALSDGRVIEFIEQDASIKDAPEVILAGVTRNFDELLIRHGQERRIWGIGVSFPGPIEFATGCPIAPSGIPAWHGFVIRQFFQQRYGAATWVDNDVNVLALAEVRHGVAHSADEAMIVKVGTGIGVGIIAGRNVHRGNQGCAGNIGHTPTGADGLCRCGNRGCLETVAGGDAIAQHGQALAQQGTSQSLAALQASGEELTAIDVARAAELGDHNAQGVLEHAGTELGTVLAQFVNFFNPDLLVLSGGVSRAGASFINAIRLAVHTHSMTLAARDLQVIPTTLGADAGMLGCMHLVLDELFRPEFYVRWAANGCPAGVLVA